MRYAPDLIEEALSALPPSAWSLPSTYEKTEVHHGYRRVVLADGCRWREPAEHFRFILEDFEPINNSWLSWIDPGGFIIPHQDPGPFLERWQVPLRPSGLFTVRAVTVAQDVGVPFRVEHWAPHSVWNFTNSPRIHLVVDRDIPVDRPSTPFETFPVPAHYQEAIRG